MLGPRDRDREYLEDVALGGGEPVAGDSVGRVGEPEALEGGEGVAAGRLGGAALGEGAWRELLFAVGAFGPALAKLGFDQ